MGRDLRHLVNTVQDLSDREISFKVLSGQGANIDTTSAAGKLVFGIFAAGVPPRYPRNVSKSPVSLMLQSL